MHTNYLGIPVLVWATFFWIAVAGTFGVLMLFRFLTTVRERDMIFMGPAEIREARHHMRQVTRLAKGFGWASAILLILIALTWISGLV